MKGIDISHHQNDAGAVDLKKVKAAGYQFAFVKCSEGLYYKDPFYTRNKEAARAAGMLFGAYHFAQSINDPVKEADHFLACVGDLNPGEIVILDWEVDFRDPAGWCMAWLKRVEEKLGFKPMLYTGESRVKSIDWKKVVAANYGLWVAKYASQLVYIPEYLQRKPVSDEWPFWAIWQFSSRAKVPGIVGNCDVNTTDMDIETLKKYGKKVIQVICTKCCPLHCK